MKVLKCNVSIDSHCFFCCLPANIFHGFSLLLLFVTSGVFLPFQVPSICRKQQADPCAQAESRVKLRLRQAMETPGKHSQCISTWCHGFCSQQGSAVGCSDQACRGPPVRSCQRGAQQDKPMDRSRLRTGGTIIFFFYVRLLNFPVAEMQSSSIHGLQEECPGVTKAQGFQHPFLLLKSCTKVSITTRSIGRECSQWGQSSQ